jgi:hypothetical protein
VAHRRTIPVAASSSGFATARRCALKSGTKRQPGKRPWGDVPFERPQHLRLQDDRIGRADAVLGRQDHRAVFDVGVDAIAEIRLERQDAPRAPLLPSPRRRRRTAMLATGQEIEVASVLAEIRALCAGVTS